MMRRLDPVIYVRQARPRDVPALGAFFRRAWREAGPGALGFTGANEAAVEEISSREFLAWRASSPRVRMYWAHDAAEVVGFARLRMEGGGTA